MKYRSILLVLFLLSLILCFNSCSSTPEEPPHTHTWGQWSPSTPATCTEAGEQSRSCPCGAIENAPLPTIAHAAGDWYIKKDATCSADGERTKTCIHCNMVLETEPIPRLEHKAGEWIIDKEPTITELGVKHTECTNCGVELERTSIPVLPHSHENGGWIVVVPPTCTIVGVQHLVCGLCGETLHSETIPLLDHTPSDWIVDLEPTCSEMGSKHTECLVCGETVSTASIAALGHTRSGWIVDLESTCLESGSKHTECLVCGETVSTASIAALGHTPSGWIVDLEPTCLETGSKHTECLVCGETVSTASIAALGHTPSGWIVDTSPSCFDDGSRHIQCSTCGVVLQTEVLVAGHTFSEEWEHNETAHWHPSTCGHEYAKENESFHNFSDWTTTTPATCTTSGLKTRACKTCGYTEEIEIAPLGHQMTFWHFDDASHWKECSSCGLKAEETSHALENGSCTICGYPPAALCERIHNAIAALPSPKMVEDIRIYKTALEAIHADIDAYVAFTLANDGLHTECLAKLDALDEILAQAEVADRKTANVAQLNAYYQAALADARATISDSAELAAVEAALAEALDAGIACIEDSRINTIKLADAALEAGMELIDEVYTT